MDPGYSDHTPLSINFDTRRKHGPKPFRFLNCLAALDEFIPTVKTAWDTLTRYKHMGAIWWKLKMVKQSLKKLNHTKLGKVDEKIQEYRQLLADTEKSLKLDLEKWTLVKESILKQKCRVKWLHLGDENSAYFFASLKIRQAQNTIKCLTNSQGQQLQNPDQIEVGIMNFYKALLGTSADQLPAIDPRIMQNGNCLTKEQQLQLIVPVTKEEVYQALEY
ncbi:uncharacterized protein LOC132637843 [Lycium barbarum]|uniref:uncharacterized protein LOC132637843 n=1 Tax=Lycium barbarum TaxID=112863 RepID=UPI00293F220A|nr:uncharacterized protein LOC132637843 [Lycium barbarum]